MLPNEYGFRHIVENELSVSNILKKVDESMLWRHYIGSSFQLNKNLCAPYRTDHTPSFKIRLDHRGRLMFSDFGRGLYGDIFNYLQMIHSESFIDSLKRVNYDFKLGLGAEDYVPLSSKPVTKSQNKELQKFSNLIEKEKSSSVKIQIIPRPYQSEDLEYWNSFGITESTLNFYNVYCVKKLFLNGVCTWYSAETSDSSKAARCYAYHFVKTDHIKCYFPFQQSQRFLSNVNNFEDIQGYYQCDVKKTKKELLILTKSMKDVMCLREMGFDAMAIHGEGHRFNEDFIRHIKKYFPVVISLYDKDLTGVRGAKYLWKKYGILPYFIPNKYRAEGCKDIADLRKTKGFQTASDFIKEIREDALKSKKKQNEYQIN